MNVKIEFKLTEVIEALYAFAISKGILQEDGETVPPDYIIYNLTAKGIKGGVCIETSEIPRKE